MLSLNATILRRMIVFQAVALNVHMESAGICDDFS